MLIHRSLSLIILPRLATCALKAPITISTLSSATSLSNLPAPPLGIYSTSFHTSTSTSRAAEMGSDASKSNGGASSFPKDKPDKEWRTVLSPAQFKVLRQNGTEPAFTSELETHSKEGVYNCAACDTPLYKSATKFKSGCGWPAFFDAIPGAVIRKTDWTFGMKRVEIRCAACNSHLGHVFEGEGFKTPTDERHCVNGICLRFEDQQDAGKM